MVLILFLISSLYAQTEQGIEAYSQKLNKDLPETYDHVTRLMRSTVENDHLVYHFIVLANKDEYAFALPKVKPQILRTACESRDKIVLKHFRKSLVYRYENEKGQSLGEFMIDPSHCDGKK